MIHVKVQVTSDLEALVAATGSVRSQLERSEQFRLDTAAKPEFGIRMNTTVEWGMAGKFAFLEHVQAAFAATPQLDVAHSVRENQQLFDKLCTGRTAHRWHDTGHWRALCRSAKRMGLAGADEAAWAQDLADGHTEERPL